MNDGNLICRLQALEREKQALEAVIETLEDGFIETDLKGDITRFNSAFCTICGFPPEEAEGLSYRRYMDEATALKVYRTFNTVYKTRVPNKAFDYEIIRKNGERRNVEISITPVRDGADTVMGFRCIMRDVTLRKTAEAELDRQRTRLAAIFTSVEDAIITVDHEMTIVEVNAAATRMCGLIPGKLPGGFMDSGPDSCSLSCKDVLRETLQKKMPIRNRQVTCGRPRAPLQRVSLSSAPLEDQNGTFLGAVLVIRDITRLTRLERELKQRHGFHRIIGKNNAMQDIYQLVEDVSDYETTVLVTGESGTGKELVARAIHDSGRRRFKPFVTVNCSALVEQLLESELFGHVKGAFTGATRDHIGRFQAAEGGTLLLDEIGDISPVIQLKLLRVLQEKEVERVGEFRPISIDVRVIACTHQDLREKVRLGRFREDLFYRLNVLEIHMPPLRERPDDIPLLVEHFMAVFEKKFSMTLAGVADEVMDLFMQYPWPGNIRELEHCIERAVILGRGKVIQIRHLSLDMQGKAGPPVRSGARKPSPEPGLILETLAGTDWNKAKAARKLGLSRKTLYQKIKKHNISLTRP
ncbi:MAG: sigma 54-interacting transcriptional regulator [Pseudomonadota bacterium]